jgi:hypothetical protein
MQVSLFRALKSANIDDEAAEKVVHAFEEHIDMAISDAMKHYDDRITAMQSVLEAKLDAGFKSMDARMTGMQTGFEGTFKGFEGKMSGMKTSIDVLKWLVLAQASLLALAGALIKLGS